MRRLEQDEECQMEVDSDPDTNKKMDQWQKGNVTKVVEDSRAYGFAPGFCGGTQLWRRTRKSGSKSCFN